MQQICLWAPLDADVGLLAVAVNSVVGVRRGSARRRSPRIKSSSLRISPDLLRSPTLGEGFHPPPPVESSSPARLAREGRVPAMADEADESTCRGFFLEFMTK
ncbi:hypothetical protein HU200_007216 [Digitaria exilis]|uniref:Uncharacterized protein n=1 Tax=Digitaria exilis TaxID=1010633 RepID=A0A835KR74_9POAL|nr:hypothetical protein HU200_007216 [Digitaria exilis]